jgi:hypothetical protein
MDHNEAIRKFEHLTLKAAEQAREMAIELEALVLLLPKEKTRQLAQLQLKASNRRSRDLRELAETVRATQRPVH